MSEWLQIKLVDIAILIVFCALPESIYFTCYEGDNLSVKGFLGPLVKIILTLNCV